MIQKMLKYWRSNRHDPTWWACVILAALVAWLAVTASSVIVLLSDDDQACIPTRSHGLICRR